MPIFEFICRTCGITFDFMKIRSNDVVECPKCEEKDERNLEKKVAAPNRMHSAEPYYKIYGRKKK